MRAALRSPDRVRGLGLIDTDAGIEPEEMKSAYEVMRAEWVEKGPSDGLAGAVAGIIMSPGYDPTPWIAKWQGAPKESVLEPFRTLMDRDDIWDRVSQIVAPAIIFHGQEDAAFPMERAERLAKELPHCEDLIRIAGAGHASNLSHPEMVNGPLRAFLRRHT